MDCHNLFCCVRKSVDNSFLLLSPAVLVVTDDSIVFQVFFRTSQNNTLLKFTRHWRETSVTGPWFPGSSFLFFLKIRITLSSFQSAGTSCSSAARLLKNHWKRFYDDIIQSFGDLWMNTIRNHIFLGIQPWKTEAKNALNTSALPMSLFLRWPSSSYNELNVILQCLLSLLCLKNFLYCSPQFWQHQLEFRPHEFLPKVSSSISVFPCCQI